jgi:hypothetical protein
MINSAVADQSSAIGAGSASIVREADVLDAWDVLESIAIVSAIWGSIAA